MNKLKGLLIGMIWICGCSALAQVGSSPRASSEEEPALQSGEDVGDFQKGNGASAKNQNSVINGAVKLKRPSAGGNGCPNGSIAAALTPDNRTLSILFDSYIAEAGDDAGTRRDIKNCTINIPVEIPAGMRVMVVKIDYRGYHSLPNKARARYLALYSLLDAQTNNQIGRRIRRRTDFRGPEESDLTLSSDISTRRTWSNCGKNAIFRIDSRIIATSNSKGEPTLAMLDSLDASASSDIQYHLLWERC